MRYVFDLDGTICTQTNSDYHLAEPFKDRILLINSLYDQGNDIIIHTARGMSSSDIDKAKLSYFELTKNQLYQWGVKYNELIFGKPSGDIYIDDKGLNANEFF